MLKMARFDFFLDQLLFMGMVRFVYYENNRQKVSSVTVVPTISAIYQQSLKTFVPTNKDLPMYLFYNHRWHALQFFGLFKSIRDYFPLRIKKLADLSPDRNYLLVGFPHGCIPFGCVSNWIFNAAGRAELFPDIDVRIVTLNINFLTPFAREFFMTIGEHLRKIIDI